MMDVSALVDVPSELPWSILEFLEITMLHEAYKKK